MFDLIVGFEVWLFGFSQGFAWLNLFGVLEVLVCLVVFGFDCDALCML